MTQALRHQPNSWLVAYSQVVCHLVSPCEGLECRLVSLSSRFSLDLIARICTDQHNIQALTHQPPCPMASPGVKATVLLPPMSPSLCRSRQRRRRTGICGRWSKRARQDGILSNTTRPFISSTTLAHRQYNAHLSPSLCKRALLAADSSPHPLLRLSATVAFKPSHSDVWVH
ncbi:hypothetical protein GGS23DRAFT_268953 [Durotheca rogersii]|uniref:uncharacterized protein n=1 Tax=Durotheca rogersii TaxID=419775 RepID=UPI0022210187|nr:uncharacterized protein GGS23DRAFT_268953 [Durotheca rogersii]KAI5859755.1 hypothetical protein GGS23DRAFT_268953 [Durotheca rogersii]